MFKSYLVKSCHNGVQRSGLRKRLPATRSTYAFNKTHCVKGHRAGRLFNYNNKMIDRRFQNEHRLPSMRDEQLISQALSALSTKIEEVKANAKKELEESSQIGDPSLKQAVQASCKRMLTNPKVVARDLVKSQYPEIFDKLTERQKKRNEFVRDPKNKICFVCGSRGHVSKECQSEKKFQARQKRTINYKKHLGEKGLYKVDVDAAYKKIQKQLDDLKLDNARLVKDNISLKHEVENLTSELQQLRVTGKDVSQATQIVDKIVVNKPQPLATVSHVETLQVTGCIKSSDKRSLTDGKSNYCYGCAQGTLTTTVIHAAVLSFVLMLIAIITGSTPIYSGVRISSYSMKIVKLAQNTTITTTKQVWKLTYVVTCLINIVIYILSRISIPLVIFVGLAMMLIRVICRMMSNKVNGMLEWNAIDMYRKSLQKSGYTFRLPYKVSQIESKDCPGTKLDAYRACYTAVMKTTSIMTVFCMYTKALYFVIRNILGYIELWYKYSRGWFKRIVKKLVFVVKIVLLFMLGVVVIVIRVLLMMLRIVIKIVFTKQFAALALVAGSLYFARVYAVTHIINGFMQFSGICKMLRAKCAYITGMMTLNPIRLVQLITARCHFIKVHDIIDILVKTVGHLFKRK